MTEKKTEAHILNDKFRIETEKEIEKILNI